LIYLLFLNPAAELRAMISSGVRLIFIKYFAINPILLRRMSWDDFKTFSKVSLSLCSSEASKTALKEYE
jgi:hypothetical protein